MAVEDRSTALLQFRALGPSALLNVKSVHEACAGTRPETHFRTAGDYPLRSLRIDSERSGFVNAREAAGSCSPECKPSGQSQGGLQRNRRCQYLVQAVML